MQKQNSNLNRTLLYLSAAAFALLGVFFAVTAKEKSQMIFGYCAPLLLFIPFILARLKIHPTERFCTLLYLFLSLAYDIGFAAGGYDRILFYDKFVHFLSGCFNMMAGSFLYLLLNKGAAARKPPMLLFGMFFSMFIGLVCEFVECTVFLISGFDAQHTLTTGVFDTMGDLLATLLGTLLIMLIYVLYLLKGVKFFPRPIIAEFCEKNRCNHEG